MLAPSGGADRGVEDQGVCRPGIPKLVIVGWTTLPSVYRKKKAL